MGKYWDEILSYRYSQGEIEYANWMWEKMFIERQNSQNPMAGFLPNLRQANTKLFIIATENDEWYNFYGGCNYDDEIHFINHSMSQLPDNCQVIVTIHGWNEQKLRVHISDLAKEDTRIIDDDRVYDVPFTSQSILPYCDGVICISSGVGLQAKMWGVPLACPGKSHLTRMSDTADISKLHEFDTRPEAKQARRNEIAPYVYFAAARQSVHQEAEWYNPEPLVDIVLNWLDCAARGVTPLEYFERLGNRDFERARATVMKDLVDLTPERLEIWRLSEKGLLKGKVEHGPLYRSQLRKVLSRMKRFIT